MKRRCLVIGGGGFIGRRVVNLLVEHGRNVTVLGRRPSADAELPAGCHYVHGDYGNRALLSELLSGCAEVVDLAYSTVPKTSYQDPVYDLVSNLPASVGLLQEAAASGVQKVLFVSSGGTVYGPAQHLPIAEDHPTEPISPYGITKLAIEKYARMFSRNSDLHVVVGRPGNAYGESQRPGTGQGFIAAAVHAVLNSVPIEVFGGDGTVRDYIHVEDIADGLVTILDSGANGECYNIGTGIGSSNRQVIDLIEGMATATGFKLEVDAKPPRSFDVPENVLDSSKLTAISGWKPRISLQEGIECVWNHALCNLSPV
jgi:UDP-glucose 4-epimerase